MPETNPNPTLIFLLTTLLTTTTALLLHHLRRKPPRPPPPRAPPTTPSAITALARAYLLDDPDPSTRNQLQTYLHQLATAPAPALRTTLITLLDPANRLRFGTAGLRAPLGLGVNRINLRNASLLAHAVYKVLPSHDAPILIGYDHRHQSDSLAAVIASVFLHFHLPVRLFLHPVPTPLVAYTAKKIPAQVAFCVTASHNPPSDNGIKLFWNDAIQIRPDVADRIEAVFPKVRPNPNLIYYFSPADIPPHPELGPYPYVDFYYDEICTKLQQRTNQENAATPPVVYTALHGVGYEAIETIFRRFSLPQPIDVTEQCIPDPDFPTLPFPNPEEPGALDRALATAKRHGCRLVLANDPDADRLGVAEVTRSGTTHIFSGNEIALLLADYLSVNIPVSNAKCAVVASTVSSKILSALADSRGFSFHEALTGFKWLNKVAAELEKKGKTVLITYEEALGFNVTQNIVRDKDGISAAAVFAEMAGTVYSTGEYLIDRLEELKDECGAHVSKNGYLKTCDGSWTTQEVFEKARERGLPTKFGEFKVISVRDLTRGTDTAEWNGKARLPADARGQFLTFRCAREYSSHKGDCPLTIHLRGSGTEPKIKFYSELRCTRDEERYGFGQALLASAVDDAIHQVLRPKEAGLIR